VKLTLIARVTDGLPLAEGLETDKDQDLEYYKQQAKVRPTCCSHVVCCAAAARSAGCGPHVPQRTRLSRPMRGFAPQTLFKKMSQGGSPPSRMSYESGPYYLHYLIEAGVCYLTLCERGYPKKLAYQYLEDLQREFHHQNQDQVGTVARPYAFIKFGTPRARTRAMYASLVMRVQSRFGSQLWRHGSKVDGAREVSNSTDAGSGVIQTPSSRRPSGCIWTRARSAT
jgi:hypothetical protein